MNADALKQMIQECFPQIPIYSAMPNDEGWDFYVLEINGEFVFRFPRRQDGEISFEREVLLLPELAKRLSVRVPHYEFVWRGDGTHKPFGGYRKIQGTPLAKDYLKSAQPRHLAQQLSKFLSELHQFLIQDAIRLKIPYFSSAEWRQKYRDKYARVRAQCFPLLDAPARAKAKVLWENFLTDDANFRFKPALIHGDLGGEHIVCDPGCAAIVGIIDWGDVSIGDPALDFAGLLRVCGRDFVEEMAGGYQDIDETFWQRLAFYSRRIPFATILYGINLNDAAKLNDGLEQLRAEQETQSNEWN